jgi:hypothetical protein
MPQQPTGRRHRLQLLLPGRLRRVGAAGAVHMTISGAQELDCSAGLGVYVPGSGQAAKGLMVGITRDLYAAHKPETASPPSSVWSAEPGCPIRLK